MVRGKCLVVQFRKSVWALGAGRVGLLALAQAFTLCQFHEDLNEVIQPPKVAVLPVPFYPRHVVLQGLSLRKWCGFPKINHPDFGLLPLVMDEEEGTPYDLQKEMQKSAPQQSFVEEHVGRKARVWDHKQALGFAGRFQITGTLVGWDWSNPQSFSLS